MVLVKKKSRSEQTGWLHTRQQGLNGKERVRTADCGLRSVENEECRKCGVWKMRSVENVECERKIYKKLKRKK